MGDLMVPVIGRFWTPGSHPPTLLTPQGEVTAALLNHLSGASVSEMMEEKLSTDEGGPQVAAAGRPKPAPQLSAERAVRWYGIAALPRDVLLEGLECEALAGAGVPPEVAERIRAGRPEYHVTLWHVDESSRLGDNNVAAGAREAVRAELSASVGQQAIVEVVAVDWNDSVVAAEVRRFKASWPQPVLC